MSEKRKSNKKINLKGCDTIRKSYKTEYIPFTEEQKQRAANTDLAAFVLSQGEELKRCGSEMLWEAGGRVMIRDNMWYSHYEQKGGNTIDFVRKFYNLSYQDAVQMILDERIEPLQISKQQKEKKTFALPEKNDNMRQVFAYLLRTRFIARSIIEYFAHEDLLYESKEYHNCVFVGRDSNGVAKHAHKRGTYTRGEPFKGNVDDCDAEYSFHYTGTSDKLYVFEAPIDMLSFLTLHPKNWKEHSYVSLCSVADHAMVRMLKDNPQISKIYLCLDNDAAGINAEYRIRQHLKELGYTDVTFLRPKFKDWNEILRERNGLEPLPAVPHPTLYKMREHFKNTVTSALNSNSLLYPYKTLRADYVRLTVSKTPEEIISNSNRLAIDALRMAKDLLHADGKELMQGLIEQYLPHRDEVEFESKQQDIQNDMESAERLFGTNQIRISTVLKQDVQNLYRLACDSLRMELHVELELQNQAVNFTEEQEGGEEPFQQSVI